MGLLWKREGFPFNRTLAESRLQALKRRFNRVPGLEEKYWYVIDDYVARGYARRLSEREASKRSKVAWYLPYYPVLNVNKPNKVRVVFDAATQFDGIFLNDRLYHGPNPTNNLVGVLIPFREEETAFTADKEAMFHQVKVLSDGILPLVNLLRNIRCMVYSVRRHHLAAPKGHSDEQQMTIRVDMTPRLSRQYTEDFTSMMY